LKTQSLKMRFGVYVFHVHALNNVIHYYRLLLILLMQLIV